MGCLFLNPRLSRQRSRTRIIAPDFPSLFRVLASFHANCDGLSRRPIFPSAGEDGFLADHMTFLIADHSIGNAGSVIIAIGPIRVPAKSCVKHFGIDDALPHGLRKIIAAAPVASTPFRWLAIIAAYRAGQGRACSGARDDGESCNRARGATHKMSHFCLLLCRNDTILRTYNGFPGSAKVGSKVRALARLVNFKAYRRGHGLRPRES